MGTRRHVDCCRACGSYETDPICIEEKKREKEGLPTRFPFNACAAHIRRNLEYFPKEAADWAQNHR